MRFALDHSAFLKALQPLVQRRRLIDRNQPRDGLSPVGYDPRSSKLHVAEELA
jgi:hypothetical protein